MSKSIFLPLFLLFLCVFVWNTTASFQNNLYNARLGIANPDTLLYLRWNEQSLIQGHLIEDDFYEAYPHNIKINLPPLPRLVLYHFSRLMFIFFPNISCETAVGYIPPLTGTFVTLLMILFIFLKTDNLALAFFVLIFSLPDFLSHMTNSYLSVDHHYLNNLFIWLWVFFGWHYCKYKNNFSVVAGGITTFLFLITWVGAPLFFGITTVLALSYWIFNMNFAKDYISYLSDSLIIGGGVLVANFILHKPIGGLLDLGSFGWFQSASILFMGVIINIFRRFFINKSKILVFLLAIIVILIAFSTLPPLVKGLDLMTNETPILKTVSELKSMSTLLNLKKTELNLNIFTVVFGPIFMLIPIFLFVSPTKIFHDEGRIIRDFLLISILLSLHQVRYCRWLSNAYGIIPGIIIYEIFHALYITHKKNKSNIIRLTIAFAIIITMMINTNYCKIKDKPRIKPYKAELYNWLKINTPETNGYTNNFAPSYGILNFWDRGNAIAYYAHRPPAANNAMRGLKTMASIYSSESEKEAFNLCSKYKIRYVMAEPGVFSSKYIAYLDYLKRKAKGSEFIFGGEKQIQNVANDKISKTFYTWITYFAGMSYNAKFTISSHFRFCWVSKPDPKKPTDIPKCMLYQVVKGCKITGKTSPLQKIEISLKIKVANRHMSYKKNMISDKYGKFNTVVCYPTSNKSGRIETSDSYKISIVDDKNKIMQTTNLKVSVKDIESGGTKKIIF